MKFHDFLLSFCGYFCNFSVALLVLARYNTSANKSKNTEQLHDIKGSVLVTIPLLKLTSTKMLGKKKDRIAKKVTETRAYRIDDADHYSATQHKLPKF